jgi:hypothetical protein
MASVTRGMWILLDWWSTSVPLHITHMYFTLSAYSSQTIAPFTEVYLSMHDPANKNKQPMEYGAEHLKSPAARSSQAVIMCSVTRNPVQNSFWEIAVDARLSRGNNKSYYAEIVQTILRSFSTAPKPFFASLVKKV